MENCLVVYTQQSKVTLVEDKTTPRSKTKGVIDFVHYIRYRDSIVGEYILKAKSLKELKQQFFSQYAIVRAAGGVVFNEKAELLIIFRRGFWDLPKGKFEPGETKRECALREVKEETGIQEIELVGPLSLLLNGKKTTYHTYRHKRKPTIKPSYWYIMKALNQTLIPQSEEDIEKAIWVSKEQLEKYIPKMYPAIQDIAHTVLQMDLDQVLELSNK